MSLPRDDTSHMLSVWQNEPYGTEYEDWSCDSAVSPTLIAELFACALDAANAYIRPIDANQRKSSSFNDLVAQRGLMRIWGLDFGVIKGFLDERLREDAEVRGCVISLLTELSSCFTSRQYSPSSSYRIDSHDS